MLKNIIILAVLMNVYVGCVYAEGVTLIQLGQGVNPTSNVTNEHLKERVKNLELAVQQLQRLVQESKITSTISKVKPSIIHCYARDNILQTHISTGTTEVEAKGKILKECIYCKPEEITCD